jgi:hypothetical protein
VDVLQAIHRLVKAEKSVAESTIRHCWLKSGIVPPKFVEGLKAMDRTSAPIDWDSVLHKDQLQEHINQAHDSGYMEDPISAQEFIEIDDHAVGFRSFVSRQIVCRSMIF